MRIILSLLLLSQSAQAAFEGSNTNYLLLADAPSLRGTNGLTVGFGIRGVTIAVGGQNSFMVLIQRGLTAVQWRIWDRANNFSGTPGGSGTFMVFYEGPGRNANDWISGTGVPIEKQDYRMETASIQFSNPSPFWLNDRAGQGAGSWLSGAGTDLDIVVNEQTEIGPRQTAIGTAFVMGNLLMSETCIYNTNLNFIQCQTLTRSHVKRIALQIRPANLVCYLPMDDASDGTWITATNSFRDLSGNGNHASPAVGAGQVLVRAERICSYPPNE